MTAWVYSRSQGIQVWRVFWEEAQSWTYIGANKNMLFCHGCSAEPGDFLWRSWDSCPLLPNWTPHLCGLRGHTDWGLPSWIPFLWHNRGETGALIVDCNPLATQRRRTKKQPKPLKILYLTPHLSVCWEPWEKIQRLRPEHCGCQELTPKQKEGLLLLWWDSLGIHIFPHISIMIEVAEIRW